MAAGYVRRTVASDDPLLSAFYNDLRKLAANRLAAERAGHTLSATALVHDVYLRLASAESPERWADTAHFFNAAAEAMRRVLVDHARAKQGGSSAGGNRTSGCR